MAQTYPEDRGQNYAIRIGRDDPTSHERFFLDSPAEVNLLLEGMLVRRLGAMIGAWRPKVRPRA